MRKYGLIKLGLAAVMLTSASAASEGADVSGGPAYLPPAPPLPFVYNWTGFYAGAHHKGQRECNGRWPRSRHNRER